MKEERMRKVYVQVKVEFTPEGQMRPRELVVDMITPVFYNWCSPILEETIMTARM